MRADPADIRIHATKPGGRPARMLAELGIAVLPVAEDEGNVDRYLLSRRLAVERRTGSSFLAGVMDKTLFTSAIYLRERFAIPVLVVEGAVNYERSRFDPRAVRGALSSMLLAYGLNVLSTPTVEETVTLIAMMARQEQVGIPEISLIPKRKAPDLPDMQRRIVEMLPGCGRVMARDLLQHFGSVRRLLNATEDEFRAVPGLGKKKAAAISRLLGAEYEAVDTEKHLEAAIEAEPGLIFDQPVILLARQHGITLGEARHIVDLVFLDPEADELILVEAKRGRLAREHYHQLRRYLDSADESRLLRGFLRKGTSVRGLLVTVEEGPFRPEDPAVSVRIVDRRRTIDVLKRLRASRLAAADS